MAERGRRLARLFRAESLLTQTEVEERTGIDRVTTAHYEAGREKPTRDHLERLAGVAGMTVEAGEEILKVSDALRGPRLRQGRGAADLMTELGDTCHAHRAWQRFLRLRLPDPAPAAEDRERVRGQLAILKDLSESERLAVVRAALEFQTRALAEEAALASRNAADPREARSWANLAAAIEEAAGLRS